MSLDEGNILNMEEPEESPPPEEKGNRTFMIVGGIMGGLVFLTLICIAVYFFVLGPRLTAQRASQQATIEAENAQVMQQMTGTAEAALWTNTPLPTNTPSITPIPNTPTASRTPVVVLNSPTAVSLEEQATMAAAQTQLAEAMTATLQAELAAAGTRAVGGGTGMPSTGFFDEIGLPAMLVLAGALVVVIFLARRLRKSPTR
jgi:type II secretory pathway pseudopilin PulG